MWHAMSPQNGHTRSVPNGDGSSTIFVHHIGDPSGGAAQAPPPPQQQQQMPQVFTIPMPYPMPMQSPAPPPQPTFMPYPAYPPPPPPPSCPYQQQPYQQQQYQPQYQPQYHQQQQQPNVVILQQEEPKPPPPPEKKTDKKKPEEKKPEEKPPEKAPAEEKPPAKEPEKPPEPEPPSGPQRFSKFSIVSLIIFALGLVFGTGCIIKTYDADDSRQDSKDAGLSVVDNEDYAYSRSVALGMGCVAALCFTIATLCSFFAGLRHKLKSDEKDSCCLGGFVIAGWIVFCITFIVCLIILVMAFDEENVIYPEVVVVGFVGSILSWMLMFGYSEMARRL